jgi:hypothetical protein
MSNGDQFELSDQQLMCPAQTPGTRGLWDQGDPDVWSLPGMTPGTCGVNDYGATVAAQCGPSFPPPAIQPEETLRFPDREVAGSVVVGTGMASVVRIPVPGTNGLHIELSPRGWTPHGGSTSTVFIQDSTGKQHLRLDYGYNTKTGKVDYHWNVGKKGKGFVKQKFGVADHAPAGRGGPALYRGAKFFRYAGRALLVVGIAADVYSIAVARKRYRQVLQVASGWAGAWIGCKVVGAGGAALGTAIEPGGGTAIGGLGGCVVGGIGGYLGFSTAAGEAYDWVEETYFVPLPESEARADVLFQEE